jgi:hypothetical protein
MRQSNWLAMSRLGEPRASEWSTGQEKLPVQSIKYSTKPCWHLHLLQGTRCNDLEVLLLFNCVLLLSRSACRLSRLLTSYSVHFAQAFVLFIFVL